MAGNREYKSDVFSMLLEDKRNALEVYNAMNESSYTDPELVEIHTLDKGVSLTVRNDAAFVVDASLSVYEHQSTVCPNMPVRCLVYYTTIVEKMLKNRNIYAKYRISIPVPRSAVFYNGQEDQPEYEELKLSDAFEKKTEEPELELTCRVYNINKGYNKELLGRCRVLREYMIFIDYVREYHKEQGFEHLETAINRAIDRCIEENVLASFLRENCSEVVKVTEMDYTFDRQIMLEREEAITVGRAEGRAEERSWSLIEKICKKIRKGIGYRETAEMLEEEAEVVFRIYEIAEDYAPNYDVDKIYHAYVGEGIR